MLAGFNSRLGPVKVKKENEKFQKRKPNAKWLLDSIVVWAWAQHKNGIGERNRLRPDENKKENRKESKISSVGLKIKKKSKCGERGSNTRPSDLQSLPTELFPHVVNVLPEFFIWYSTQIAPSYFRLLLLAVRETIYFIFFTQCSPTPIIKIPIISLKNNAMYIALLACFLHVRITESIC